MKKKICIALALLLVLAMTLSVTAHATEPSQAIAGSGDDGTAISITDITPREGENKEDSKDETKGYTVSSYYPVSVQTAEEGGVQLLVKTFLVPPDTAPTELIEKDLTRRGVAYEAIDILRQEQPGEVEKKTVSQAMTLESETDKMEDTLPLLKSTMDYQKDGFSGALTLDRDSIQVKETGTSNYSYQLKETKEYTGLDRNDPYYIPKTTEKNGVTLKLADVKWTPMASGAENSEVPSLYRATALYTGIAWGEQGGWVYRNRRVHRRGWCGGHPRQRAAWEVPGETGGTPSRPRPGLGGLHLPLHPGLHPAGEHCLAGWLHGAPHHPQAGPVRPGLRNRGGRRN